MLNSFQAALYQRLQDFELDDPTHEFGFTRHLMKNQGWTLTYAQRAIAEYKKFAFLTVVANHYVVPSDQVDQVWHAHVLLTQSYWEEFCPKVLEKNLHHHPARGGRTERAEFHHLYVQTITSYRYFFGSPPEDIWSPPDIRFGAELKMQRVNLSEHWVIPKRLPQLRLAQPLAATAIITFVTVGCVDVRQESSLGRFVSDLIANHSITIFTLSAILGLILRYSIRIPDKQPQKPQLDIYQIAYLAGGKLRAVELAITQLVHQGYLRPNVRHRTLAIEKALSPEATNLERQVMQQVHQTPHLQSLRQTSKYKMDFLQKRLEEEKLLMAGWAGRIAMSFGLFLPIAILGGVASVFLNKPLMKIAPVVDIITILWTAIGIITACCFVPSVRTRWGSRILGDIKKNHDVYDVTQRFALYGYGVLSGGALDDLKQMFKAEDEEAASGGCGC
ncbi:MULTISPECIES: TIGR04222 domain-containing membrane protein [Nostoc]|uniref:TIGR04222 domain-containing membrane protein n=1 Tax=Nostoc paludosum FACHB-159 TaxID=2692908 RepID=A0ABR8K0A2_9NOSO|nr:MULTISPECIES: TIGR04222 domain-containing membrane protein [Nostoc]MBD2677288.1 TIGR04222 domain-containing membrane protein [Nostoc sp. FACHB-857]MBD2732902.1 TIGR04222 domain-containing membrane protein [Nostoc paludosum FACHB-159]